MTATKKHTLDLTQGSILKQMLTFLLPLFLSTLVQQLYNSADRMVGISILPESIGVIMKLRFTNRL